MYFAVVEAQKSPKQREVSRSVLRLLLWMGTRTSFGSVCMSCTVSYLAIMREFSYYGAILYIWQPTVWQGRIMQQTSGIQTWSGIPLDACAFRKEFLNTTQPILNATSSRQIILPQLSCFWEREEAKIAIDTEIQLISQPYFEFKLSYRW